MGKLNVDTILVRRDWWFVFEQLTTQQRGQVFRAIVDFASGKNPEVFDVKSVQLAFDGISVDLVEDIANFESMKKGRSLAGKKSAEKRRLERNKAEQKSTKATNPTESDTDTDTESESDLESNSEIESEYEGAHSQSFGTYGQVRLTKDEVVELKAEMGSEFEAKVNYLSEYMEIHGKSYANHEAILTKWYREDFAKNQAKCNIPSGLEQEAIRKTIEQFGAAGSAYPYLS